MPEITTVWPSMDIRVANAPTLGTSLGDKSLQIPTCCPTWGRWGVTLIGALHTVIKGNEVGGT